MSAADFLRAFCSNNENYEFVKQDMGYAMLVKKGSCVNALVQLSDYFDDRNMDSDDAFLNLMTDVTDLGTLIRFPFMK